MNHDILFQKQSKFSKIEMKDVDSFLAQKQVVTLCFDESSDAALTLNNNALYIRKKLCYVVMKKN